MAPAEVCREPQPPASGALERTLVRAIAWTGAAMGLAQFLSWGTTIYVARILSPADYGLFAMATVYLGLVSLVSEFGIGSAVIVLRELEGAALAELNTMSVIVGFFCFAVSCALARPLGVFFSSSGLSLVVVVMSLAFVMASFKVVPESLLQRQLRFKLLAHVDGLKAALQAVATTIAAVAGMRYWSLVVGYLVATFAGTVLVLAFQRYRFAWPHPRALKPALRLSRDVLVTRVGWYLHSNSDFLIAGKVLGETPLGVYRLAWSISNIPVDKITAMVVRTSQAFFSTAQEDYAALRRYLLGLTEGLALLTLPTSIGLVLVADPLVALVLGPRWAGVVLPLQFLALYAAVRSLTPLIPPILTVTGNSAFLARNTVWVSIVLPIGFYLSSRWGAAGIAAAWAIMYPASVIPFYWRAFHQIELSFREYFNALCAAIQGSIVLTAAVLAAKYNLPAGLPLFLQLGLLTTTGVAAYAGFILLFHSDRVRVFKQTINLLRTPGVAQ
jgi:O-antigen/teichoic acid export membrane protein